MEYVKLNNGVEMPMLGFGVYQIPAEDTKRCVLDAVSVGYRSIDTAQGYANEAEVGEAVKTCGIPREELFLTTKIWISNGGYEKARVSIDESLRRLKTDYIDLMLIHQPFNDYYGTYRAMEEACRSGKIRAIGVSNFMPDRFIDIAGFVETVPAVNQLEVHVFQQQKKAREILGIDQITDAALAQAGGADLKDFQKEAKVPETFGVKLTIPMVVGYQVDGKLPEMPEDIRAGYEQAMRDQGLGTTDEAYENFTEEQKEIEHQLFNEMWNQYGERFPETREHPNQYENWWVEGPWEFSFQVNKNSGGTVVKEINDVDENGLGLVSVTKTPFEIIIDDGNESADYFTVALDADGDILENGIGGSTNTLAIQDRDVSKIDVYICDYMEYMDELKGYYWSEDYETKKKEKTFAQLLDERALYHKEIVFEN